MAAAGVTITATPFRHDAELVKLHLEESGVEAWLVDEGVIGAHPWLANAVGWIKVNVAAEDEERARAIVSETGRDAVDATGGDGTAGRPEEDRCLACGAAMPEEAETCAGCGWTYSAEV